MLTCPNCLQALNPNGCIICKAKEMLDNPAIAKVLDFDKTMFATGDIQAAANPITFGHLGVSVTITHELAESFRGKNDEEIFAMLLGDEHANRIDEAIRLRNEVLEQLASQLKEVHKLLLPGMDSFIKRLHSTGQHAGIASVSPDSFIHAFLQRTSIGNIPLVEVFPLDGVIGSTKVRQICAGITPLFKPDPFSLYQAAERIMHNSNTDILYIGDSRVDALSVRGQSKITGVIIDKKKYKSLLSEFGEEPNLGIIRSMKDLLAA